MTRLTRIFTVVFILGCIFGSTAQAQIKTPPIKDVKIGVIGASVSAGFGSDYTLSEAIAAAVKVPVKTFDTADNFFFANYETSSPKRIAKLKRNEVDVIVALDYLFWFASGKKTLDERKTMVSNAIGFLKDVKVPVLVGTIPEMRNVSQFMLRKDRIIPPAEVKILNKHLNELVAKQKNLHLLPLANWIDCLNNATIVPGMEHVSDEDLKKSDIFLADGLHLNRKGLVFGAAMIVKQLKDMKVVLNDENATHKVDKILERLGKNDTALAIEVRDSKGALVKDGTLRINMPSIQELMSSGFSMGELVKLRSLDKYTKPISLKNNNPVKIMGIPAAAARLKVRVRAEGPESEISAWQTIALDTNTKKPHVIKLTTPYSIKLQFVGAKSGQKLAGMKVASRTEARSRGHRNTKNLPTSFLGQGISDDKGQVTLIGIGPETHRLVIQTASGAQVEQTVEYSPTASGPNIIMIDE
ncbi:MAG: hypothetical protein ACI97A_000382 [Planctomycetota bacterium]|jgi:hypothetical protein